MLRPFSVELEDVESVDLLLLLEFVTLEKDVLVEELDEREVSVLEVVSQLLRLLLLLELVELTSLVEDDDCGDTELVVFSRKVELESVELVVLMLNVESVLEVDSELLDIDESVSSPTVELLQLVEDRLVSDCSDGEISLGVELLFSTNVEVEDVLLELEFVDLDEKEEDENVIEEVLPSFCEELESVDLLLFDCVELEEVVKSPRMSDEFDPT